MKRILQLLILFMLIESCKVKHEQKAIIQVLMLISMAKIQDLRRLTKLPSRAPK